MRKKIVTSSFLLLLATFFAFCFFNSCKKNEVAPVFLKDSIYDIDGNLYKTIKIGNQWWMAENLKVKRFRHGGTMIGFTETTAILWDTLKSGAYCYYQDIITAPGLLYNWYAVSGDSIAPEGWHVATDADWKQLEMFLGMSKTDADAMGWRGTDQGNKLKPIPVIGTTIWDNENVDVYSVYGTGESGFNALAGSCRLFDSVSVSDVSNIRVVWGNPGLTDAGYWWTATQHPDSIKYAWYRGLDYLHPNVFRYYARKPYGFSIRCVKN